MVKSLGRNPRDFRRSATKEARMGLLDRFFKTREEPKAANPYPEFERLVEQSMEELRLKTAAHDGAWDLAKADWAVDQNAGTLTFTSPKGIVATCSTQIIATRNSLDGSFMWGWDHPSVPEPLQQHATVVREYGEQHGYKWLTTQIIQCPEDKAWQLVALACKLNDAQGAYRGPTGDTTVFMTFDDVSLTKAE